MSQVSLLRKEINEPSTTVRPVSVEATGPELEAVPRVPTGGRAPPGLSMNGALVVLLLPAVANLLGSLINMKVNYL